MSDTNSIVEYRDIEGFPGYRVGNDGSVWSQWESAGRGSGRGTKAVGAWKKLKQRTDERRRKYVAIYANGKSYVKLVHRLILTVFVGPPVGNVICCHYDGNPENNLLSNLRWATHKDNSADARRHGTWTRGSKQGNSVLTENQVVAIRNKHRLNRKGYRETALEYGITAAAVGLIVRRKNWKHIS